MLSRPAFNRVSDCYANCYEVISMHKGLGHITWTLQQNVSHTAICVYFIQVGYCVLYFSSVYNKIIVTRIHIIVIYLSLITVMIQFIYIVCHIKESFQLKKRREKNITKTLSIAMYTYILRNSDVNIPLYSTFNGENPFMIKTLWLFIIL